METYNFSIQCLEETKTRNVSFWTLFVVVFVWSLVNILITANYFICDFINWEFYAHRIDALFLWWLLFWIKTWSNSIPLVERNIFSWTKIHIKGKKERSTSVCFKPKHPSNYNKEKLQNIDIFWSIYQFKSIVFLVSRIPHVLLLLFIVTNDSSHWNRLKWCQNEFLILFLLSSFLVQYHLCFWFRTL